MGLAQIDHEQGNPLRIQIASRPHNGVTAECMAEAKQEESFYNVIIKKIGEIRVQAKKMVLIWTRAFLKRNKRRGGKDWNSNWEWSLVSNQK